MEEQLITREEFLDNLKKEGEEYIDEIAEDLEDLNFEVHANIALKANAEMPGIGIMSQDKRLNCFMAVCRHLDDFIERGEIDELGSKLILDILRMTNPDFVKAITAFVMFAPRFGARERVDMPRAARFYLSGMQDSASMDWLSS